MQFRNPNNGYVETASVPFLWTLLFGCFYFAVKGIWSHAIIAGILAICTGGIAWLIYPFFAKRIVRSN
jgi:hypothetical protein